jgi:hypothetical protein
METFSYEEYVDLLVLMLRNTEGYSGDESRMGVYFVLPIYSARRDVSLVEA